MIFKKAKKMMAAVLAAVMMVAAVPAMSVATGANPLTVTAEAAAKLNRSKIKLWSGATKQLKVTGTGKAVKWSSSDRSVATVNRYGKVTAKDAGKATITAKVGNKTYKCKVTVKSCMTVSKTQVVIKKGTYKDIKITYLRPGTIYAKSKNSDLISGKWLEWSGHIATLRVYGNAKGTATIKFTNTDNSEVHTLTVKVS